MPPFALILVVCKPRLTISSSMKICRGSAIKVWSLILGFNNDAMHSLSWSPQRYAWVVKNNDAAPKNPFLSVVRFQHDLETSSSLQIPRKPIFDEAKSKNRRVGLLHRRQTSAICCARWTLPLTSDVPARRRCSMSIILATSSTETFDSHSPQRSFNPSFIIAACFGC